MTKWNGHEAMLQMDSYWKGGELIKIIGLDQWLNICRWKETWMNENDYINAGECDIIWVGQNSDMKVVSSYKIY